MPSDLCNVMLLWHNMFWSWTLKRKRQEGGLVLSINDKEWLLLSLAVEKLKTTTLSMD